MCNRTAAWRGTFRSRTCICFDTRTKMNAAVQRSHGVATRLIGSSSRCAKQSSWLLRASARHVQRACSSMHVRHRLWLTTYCKTISCACIGICLNCFWPAKVSGPASQCIAMSAVSRTSLSTASLLAKTSKKSVVSKTSLSTACLHRPRCLSPLATRRAFGLHRDGCHCDLRTLLQHLSDPYQTGRRALAQNIFHLLCEA